MPETPRTCTLVRYMKTEIEKTTGPILRVGEPVEFVEKAPVDVERERLLKENEELAAWASVGRKGACVHSKTTGDCAGCAIRTLMRERERLLDLLEERHGAPDWDEDVSSRVEAVLREYGRLGDTTAEALNRRYGLPKEES